MTIAMGAKKITAVIVDDEPLARHHLRALLADDPEVEVVAESAGGAEALRVIEAWSPDLLFLEVELTGMDGFEVLERINTWPAPLVIFVTAHEQYALKAFDAQALDYLLKPFSDERFALALRRARLLMELREAGEVGKKVIELLSQYRAGADRRPEEKGYQTKFLIKSGSRVVFLRADEIDWIEAADYYVKLHAGKQSHLLRETMGELEAQLDPEHFMRIHRSAIINLRRVKEVQTRPGGPYFVVLRDGTRLKLSRGRHGRIEALLQEMS